jgi:hypothetical protein
MMKDKEAAEYAEKFEKTIPQIRRGEGGPLSREREEILLESLDSFSARYIRAKANATSKSAAEVIEDLVKKELATA